MLTLLAQAVLIHILLLEKVKNIFFLKNRPLFWPILDDFDSALTYFKSRFLKLQISYSVENTTIRKGIFCFLR